MKKIIRMIIFSAISIYLTSLWNQGFVLHFDSWKNILQAVVSVAVIYYLIIPLTKIILLPLNFLTLGLVSIVVYFLVFYLFFTRFSIIEVKEWVFLGLSIFGIIIPKTNISFLGNCILVSISISLINNLQEKLL